MKRLVFLLLMVCTGCASSDRLVLTPPFDMDGVRITKMPSLIGGIEELQASLRYPPQARVEGREGRVLLTVLIGADGVPKEIHILESQGPDLDAEAARAMAKARFEPAESDGVPIAFKMSLPITFRLRSNSAAPRRVIKTE